MRYRIWWCTIAALGLVGAAAAAQTLQQRVIVQNYDTSTPFTFEGLLGSGDTAPARTRLLVNQEGKFDRQERGVGGGRRFD